MKLKRVLTTGIKAIGIGLFSLSLLAAGLLFTHTGLNLVTWGAQQALPQLKITASEGALLPHFTLFGVHLSDPKSDLDIELEQITLGFNSHCLIEQTLCVNRLRADGLRVNVPQQAQQKPDSGQQAATKTGIPALPWPLHIDDVALSRAEVVAQGHRVTWQQLTTAIHLQGERLTLLPTLLSGLQLYPSLSGESANTATPATDKPQDIVLPEVRLPLQVDVQSLELRNANLHGDTSQTIRQLILSAEAAGQDLLLHKLNVVTPQAALRLSGKVTLAGGYPLSLRAEAELHQPPLQGQKVGLQASGSLEVLQLDAVMSEKLVADVSARLQPLKPELPFELTLTDSRLYWPLAGNPAYRASIRSMTGSGSLNGYQLALDAEVSGTQIPAAQIKLQGRGDLQQLDLQQLHLKTLGGTLAGQLHTRWQPELEWQASLQLDRLQPALQWPDAQGSLSGSLQSSGTVTPAGDWSVTLPELDLHGEIRGYPLALQGTAEASGGSGLSTIRVNTPGLTLSHGANRISVSGSLDKQLMLDSRIQLADLSKSLPQLAGSITGTISARGTLQQPQIKGELAAQRLALAQQFSLGKATLRADVVPLPAAQGTLSLTASNIAAQGQTIESVTLDLSGSQAAHQLAFYLRSALVSSHLHLSGALSEDRQRWQGEMHKAAVTTEQGNWQLQAPAALDYQLATQQGKVGAHCWVQAQSSLCLPKAAQVGRAGQASLSLNNFSFSQLARYLPDNTRLQGSVNAVSALRWSEQSRAQVSLTVTLPPGQVTRQLDKPLALGWHNAALHAHLKGGRLVSDWQLDLQDNGALDGALTIHNVQAKEPQLEGRVRAQTINLDPVAVMLDEFSQLSAQLDADLALSGPLRHPRIQGELRAEDILASGEITPLEIEKGRATLRFSGYQAALDARLHSSDGLLQLEGEADWHDLAAWSSRLHLHADELDVSLPPELRIKVQPDLTLQLDPQTARVVGDITLPWGRIEVDELPESAIAVSGDQVLLNRQLEPVEQPSSLPWMVQSDVNVHLGEDFQLSAFGLHGKLKGRLNVSQKDKGPFILGEVTIHNGSYRSFGQDLVIREGLVLMNGPADQPYLQIEAVRNPDNTQDDVVAGITVTGAASQPQVEVFSEPVMPQQNALSYLLRGHNIDGEAGGNAMTTALIGLSLAKSGRLVGQIGEAFGVSDLQLDTAGSGDSSQVTVSGYILPGLQVKYGVGIFDSVGEFTVRYRLLQDLYLQAVSGVSSAVDLLYQFEFD